MEVGGQMICDRCKKSVPVSEVRYYQKGKDSLIVVCASCRAKNLITDEDLKAAKKELTKRKVYVCIRCNYKFTFDENSKQLLKCPYCGKRDKLTKNLPNSAEGLLQSVSGDEE